MKSIKCHYQDGSLVFRTSQSYPYATAFQILQAFSLAGLISRLRGTDDSYRVIGSLPIGYDPFESNNTEWNRVVDQLVRTKEMLETKIGEA